MRIRYTPRAFSDLQNIYNFIEKRNPIAARQVIGLLERVIGRLADFPESGQRSDELDVRIVFARRYPYRIYYRIVTEEIFILHVRHVARRTPERSEM